MFRKIWIASIVMILVAACGTVATPVFEAPDATPTLEAEANEGDEVASVPTATEVPPTATPEPPTATPEPPTATPTEEPVEEEAPADEPIDDPLALSVQFSDASAGEAIFNATYETSTGPWACSTCHNVDIPDQKVGPSLLGINVRAGERVEGEGPFTYIYNSIINSQAYIVDGFAEGAQMPNYEGVLTDADVFNVIAYLMTLEE